MIPHLSVASMMATPTKLESSCAVNEEFSVIYGIIKVIYFY